MDLSLHSQNWLEAALSVKGFVWALGKVCLVASIGFAYFAGVQLFEAQANREPPLSLHENAASHVEKEKTPESAYRVILTRNIFGPVGDKEENAPAPTKVTELKLRLVGTNITNTGQSYAIIEEAAKKEQDIFVLNESVFDQAKLVAIFADKVLLKRSGREETETLFLEEGESGGQGPDGEGGPPDDQRDFSVDEEELNNALANLPRLLSQARAVPYFRGGKSIGMRLFAIRRGSLYEKLGLKNGDIIKSVNDNSLSDPTQALKLFEQLKNERSIYLTVERNSEDTDLRYSIE